MGLLTVQLGQCGNNVGHAFFKYLVNDIMEPPSMYITKKENDEYISLARDMWFTDYKNSHFIPRSVLVDTENKVISSLQDKNHIHYNNIVAASGIGSANNWALGYSNRGVKLKDTVMEEIRKEAEKCNNVTQIISFISSAGGTGSGVGSRIIESIRNEFPNKTILNVIVLPYQKGDIVTQNYNAILTLAHLHDITDGSVIFENDSLNHVCSDLLSMKNVRFEHLNAVIAQKLCSVFQPAADYSIQDFVSCLSSHPNYKFIQIRSTPHVTRDFSSYEPAPTWKSLFSQIYKVLGVKNEVTIGTKSVPTKIYTSPAKRCVSISNLIISRGGANPDKINCQLLRHEDLYPSWVYSNFRLKQYHQPRKLFDTERYLSLATNNNSFADILSHILTQAWRLYERKTYVHQYAKYNIAETEFDLAFEKMESVLSHYKKL